MVLLGLWVVLLGLRCDIIGTAKAGHMVITGNQWAWLPLDHTTAWNEQLVRAALALD